MKRVWSEAFVEEANLANNISLLRKVLGEGSGSGAYIETVPRRGYRFLAQVTEIDNVNSDQRVADGSVEGVDGTRQVSRPVFMAPRSKLTLRLALVLAISLTMVVLVLPRRPSDGLSSNPRAARFAVAPPRGTTLPPPFQPLSPALSPDGSQLVFRVLRSGEPVLAIRPIDGIESRILPGTEGGRFPFWSPDSREIAFFADGKLRRVNASGGLVRIICDAADGYGGTWNREGVILFTPSPNEGLFKVQVPSGRPTQVTWLQRNETFHQHPQFLPDGRRFIYFASPDSIYVGSLDDGAPSQILASRSRAVYSPLGFILFVKDGTLLAQRFDTDRVRLSGDPIPLADGVPIGGVGVEGRPAGGASFSVSDNGVLVYRTIAAIHRKLAWFDRGGRVVGSVDVLPFETFSDAELSPDGNQIAIAYGAQPFAEDIWVFDLTTGRSTQVTFHSGPNRHPIWSPDGEWLVFWSGRPEATGIYRKRRTGENPEEFLLGSETNRPAWPSDWGSGGVVFGRRPNGDVRMLQLGGDRKPQTLVS